MTDFAHDNQVDYRAIPSKVAQQTILQVDREFKAFRGLLKQWELNKSLPKPQLPRYLHKSNGRANVIFTLDGVSKKFFKNGILSLSPFDKMKKIQISLGKISSKLEYDSIQQVRFVKVANGYECKIIYKKPVLEVKNDNHRYLAVDFGINNLMAVGSNVIEPVLVKGHVLKSFNRYFNKRKAELQTMLDTTKNEQQRVGLQRKIDCLSQKRKNKVNDFLHKASSWLINHAVSNNINTLVIGYNKGWKKDVDLGAVNNQKFVNIPYYRLLAMIKYKAALIGINVIVTEESYTSKCSFLDTEDIRKHDVYKGKRIYRGLFKSSSGKIINADINGALNILRKVIGNFNFDPILAYATPKTVNVLKIDEC